MSMDADRPLTALALYQRAGLSIHELARRWTSNVPDTLLQLEALQVVRPLQVLRLTDDERRTRLASLRTDRLARQGEPIIDAEAVRRDVIASQRIAGIDARTYLPEASSHRR